MVKSFALAIVLLGILVWAGVCVLQICAHRKKIRLVSYLPYGWAVGMLLLYGVGGVTVRIGLLRGVWHFVVLAAAVFTIAICYWLRRRMGSGEQFSLPRLHFAYYEWIVIGLIVAKVATVLYIEMANPVIDGDAANNVLWVGLAKVIHQDGTLLPARGFTFYYAPSLLPAWVSMFLPRWQDSLVSLPWFLTYLSISGLSLAACFKITNNRFASLIVAYLFASLPLSILHAIRPGYADLILSYFFLVGITAITFAFTKTRLEHRNGLVIALVGALGGMLTKNEGVVWAAWAALIWVGYYLHFKRNIAWKKLLAAFAGLIGAGYLTFFGFATFIRTHILTDSRFQEVFEQRYDPAAAMEFLTSCFTAGSFNLWWWMFVGLLVVITVSRRVPTSLKALTLYSVVPVLLAFYLAAFTANIRYTFQQTNVSRVLLQICGLLLPCYCIFQKEIVAKLQEPNTRADKGPTRQRRPAAEG